MDDLISRQQAIDAIVKWFYDVFGIKESDGTATIFKRLRELPSAQPPASECWRCNCKKMDTVYGLDGTVYTQDKDKQGWTGQIPFAQPQWIPCSEKLPDEDEDVLVCSEDGDIDIACWMPEQWTDNPHIEWWSGEYRVYAVAWMPLPKPYGGENDE